MKIKSFILLLFLLSLLSGKAIAANYVAANTNNPPPNQVMAYYFYGNFRCGNCYRIEQYSKEAVEQYFKNEINSGKIVFKPINVEEKGNEHFVNDYQLYTKSLVISLVKNGKEVKYSNLTKVWEYLGNKEKFYNYVRDEITKYLEEL